MSAHPDRRHLFTSESVTEGHPDKVADQISDATLDAVLGQHPYARVACETLANTGLVVVSGEISTSAVVDVQEVARETIRRKPMALMLTAADATVTLCHRWTLGLEEMYAEADVVVVATGRPGLIGAQAVGLGLLLEEVDVLAAAAGFAGAIALASLSTLAMSRR